MMKNKFFLLSLTLISFQSIFAQNTKSERIEYTYIQLPLNPLASDLKNYQSAVFAVYEA